jgi:hypothetical protein
MRPLLQLGLATSVGFSQANPDPAKAAPEIIAEASGKLITALTEAIAKDGIASATSVCSERAPAIAVEVGKAHGVTLRRASEKPRNPKNAANDAEKILLAAFTAAIEKSEVPKNQTKTHVDGTATFFAPIVIANPLCLQCHGTAERDIAPLTRTAIKRLYPDDKATGYKIGDLRGLWSVTFPSSP